MLQRYKLRLGDGTVLGVDHEGLKTWEVDGQAMVQAAASHRWYPLKAFLAAERAAARRTARQRPAARERRPPGGPLPLVYPKARAEEPPPPAMAPPSETVPAETPLPPGMAPLPEEVTFAPEPLGIEALAEPLATLEDTHAQPLFEPDGVPFDAPAAEALVISTAEALAVSAGESPFAQRLGSVDAPRLGDDPGDEMPLTEDLAAAVRGDPEPAWISEDDLSALPPVDDEAPQGSAFLPVADDVGPFVADSPRALEALTEEPRARPSLQVLADDLTARPGPATPAWRPVDELPIIPLKPLDEEAPAATGRGTYDEGPQAEGSPARTELDEAIIRWFVRGTHAYDAVLTRWIGRLTRRPGPTPLGDRTAAPDAEPAGGPLQPEPPLAEVPREGERSLGEALKPPVPILDLPVLSLARVEEPDQEADVYEPEGRLSAGGRSAKRIALTSGLLASCLLAILTWETWLPRAERLGLEAFSEIDRVRHDRDHAERQRQALQEGTERLPHLHPRTIRLLMADDPAGILDPTEMFRLASDAADRGAGALVSPEARELEELRREVLEALRPSERERVRAYDTARTRRPVYSFEGQDVLELVGRGAYALPSEKRARLQDLLAKAIGAGLPTSPSPPSVPPVP